MPYRHDLVEIQAPHIDQNGYLVADAFPTKCGVFAYRKEDGTVSRELRHEDDVFQPESLESLKDRPIVDEHPANPMDSRNTRLLSRGHVGQNVERQGDHVKANLVVTDEDLIQKMNTRGKRQLSCGYTADVVEESGSYKGLPYESRQTNIRYNHLAAVWKGRAGPTAQIHLDADDAVVEDLHLDSGGDPGDPKPVGEETMTIKRKITAVQHGDAETAYRMDGVEIEYEDKSEKAVEAVVVRLDTANAHIKLLTDSVHQSEKDKKKAEGERDQAVEDGKKSSHDHARLDALADARADVKGVAAHMGLKDFNALSNEDIRKGVVALKNPKLDVDKLSAENIEGRFGMICDTIMEENKGLESLAALKVATAPGVRNDDVDPTKVEPSPRDKMIADIQGMNGKSEAEVKKDWADGEKAA